MRMRIETITNNNDCTKNCKKDKSLHRLSGYFFTVICLPFTFNSFPDWNQRRRPSNSCDLQYEGNFLVPYVYFK